MIYGRVFLLAGYRLSPIDTILPTQDTRKSPMVNVGRNYLFMNNKDLIGPFVY